VVTLAEVSGKFIAGGSIAGTIRPRKYYRIPKEALDSFLDNIEELVNFFVIEIQRIVFAENVPVTATVSRDRSCGQPRILKGLGIHRRISLLLSDQAAPSVDLRSDFHQRRLPRSFDLH